MKPPGFWQHGSAGLGGAVLAPAGAFVSLISTRRARRAGIDPGVPVFCCGNATVGGAGKTIVALDLLQRLAQRGLHPHALSRGHGGRPGMGALRVDTGRHTSLVAGDEALLLSRVAPCWVAADRVRSARAAVADGAGALVMDDGLQNFGLRKDCSLLIVDGEAGFGNGLIMPAGPLREPPRQALERCRALVLIGEDRTGIARLMRGHRPILRASLRQGPQIERLRDRAVIAFAGIGRPAKFFDGLARAGAAPVRRVAFPDHHRYREEDLRRLHAIRARWGSRSVLATTEKDLVRLPDWFRSEVIAVGVTLEWIDTRLDQVLDAALDERRER